MSGDRCAMRDFTAAIRSRSVRSTDCMYKHQRSLFFLSPLSDTFSVQIKNVYGKTNPKGPKWRDPPSVGDFNVRKCDLVCG